MRRGLLAILMFAAFAAAGASDAGAQARIQMPQQPRMQIQPGGVNKPPKLPILMIKPSVAFQRAAGMGLGKPIGIKQNGNAYIVTLKQGNVVSRVTIPGN